MLATCYRVGASTMLDLIALLVIITLGKVWIMSQSVDRLREDIAAQGTVISSVLQLVNGITEKLRDAAGDEDAVNELADELEANTAELASAVPANTPVEGVPGVDDTGDQPTG